MTDHLYTLQRAATELHRMSPPMAELAAELRESRAAFAELIEKVDLALRCGLHGYSMATQNTVRDQLLAARYRVGGES